MTTKKNSSVKYASAVKTPGAAGKMTYRLNKTKVGSEEFHSVLGPTGKAISDRAKKTPSRKEFSGKDYSRSTGKTIAPGTTRSTKSYAPSKRGKQ